MSTIRRPVDIAAPAQRVWDLLEDVRELPRYSQPFARVARIAE